MKRKHWDWEGGQAKLFEAIQPDSMQSWFASCISLTVPAAGETNLKTGETEKMPEMLVGLPGEKTRSERKVRLPAIRVLRHGSPCWWKGSKSCRGGDQTGKFANCFCRQVGGWENYLEYVWEDGIPKVFLGTQDFCSPWVALNNPESPLWIQRIHRSLLDTFGWSHQLGWVFGKRVTWYGGNFWTWALGSLPRDE